MPIHMRLPKLKGFNNRFRTEYQVVNVAALARAVPAGGTVDVDALVAAGAVRKGEPVKVLGNGELGRVKLDVTANAFSGTAREKIEAAGGSGHRAVSPDTSTAAAVNLKVRVDLRSRIGRDLRRTIARDDRPVGRSIRTGGCVLSAFASAFRTPDLRKKLLFTLAMHRALPAGRLDPDAEHERQDINDCIETPVAERQSMFIR